MLRVLRGPAESVRLSLAAAILVLLRGVTCGALLPEPDWWFTASTDASWTNKAVDEIRAAAERGDPAGQYYLGRAFFFGEVGARNAAESFRWVRRAAEQGYAQAQFALGRFYYAGVGTAPDEEEAFRWVSRAADGGHADAMGLRGMAHEFGEGPPRDPIKAREWYQKAVDAGSRVAVKWMGEYYLRREGGSAKRTNYVEALRWFERAASNGIASAAVQAADMFRKGQGTPPDVQRALSWIRLFADRNSPEMLERLAGFHTGGLAEPRGPDDTPTTLFRRAAEIRAAATCRSGTSSLDMVSSRQLADDCRELWNRYRFGIGTPRDYVASARWMWQAHEEGLRSTAAQRGVSLNAVVAPHPFDPVLKGEAPPATADERLWHQAVRLVHEALNEGHAEACRRIGESYRDGGPLTPKDPVQAWAWFHRAAESGHAPARDALEALENALTPDELGQAKRYWLPPLAKERQR